MFMDARIYVYLRIESYKKQIYNECEISEEV